MICTYCKRPVKLIDGERLYNNPKHAGKMFYACFRCYAWVGCHPGTTKPLGTLANSKLRKLRAETHTVFDPIWKKDKSNKRRIARRVAYMWLADQLGIATDDCHIALFDEQQCVKAIAACKDRIERMKKL